jgi:uncharacterized iron-regulated membrane protein
MKAEKNNKWKSFREVFHTVHLWLGVGSGLILFVVCLSGTIYTFSPEIQKLTDSKLYTVSPEPVAKHLPSETLIAHLLDSLKGGVVQSVTIPNSADASFQISVGKPEPKEKAGKNDTRGRDDKEPKSSAKEKSTGERPAAPPQRARGTTYFINPYTAEILGTGETSSSAFFMWMFRLHRWLLLDTQIGRPIVGVATIIFVIIIISGLVIWFPKKLKNWRQGLKIKTSANWKRFNHDLHNALGLYAAPFLLVMALTGLTWSFEWYKTGFNNALGAQPRKANLSSTFMAGQKPEIRDYLSAADQVLPYTGESRIMLPSDSAGVVTVMKTRDSFFATSVADRVIIDQYSAKILHTELFADKPLNEKVASSIKALHIGSFYGTFSKILYFITCLIGTSLPVTGVIIWINKLRKKRVKSEKRLAENAMV